VESVGKKKEPPRPYLWAQEVTGALPRGFRDVGRSGVARIFVVAIVAVYLNTLGATELEEIVGIVCTSQRRNR